MTSHLVVNLFSESAVKLPAHWLILYCQKRFIFGEKVKRRLCLLFVSASIALIAIAKILIVSEKAIVDKVKFFSHTLIQFVTRVIFRATNPEKMVEILRFWSPMTLQV